MSQVSSVDWYKRFRAGSCSLSIKADSKNPALEEIAAGLVKGKALDPAFQDPLVKTMLARENRASTGVGMGVAISHVPLEGLDSAHGSISLHQEGLEWSAVDGGPVHIVFTVVRPEFSTPLYDPEDHIEMMRWIASMASDGDFRAFALQAAKRSDLIELLREMQPGGGA
ncbi:MAG: PTS sugar transporter subunit IIA [Planctomycetota bacterium]